MNKSWMLIILILGLASMVFADAKSEITSFINEQAAAWTKGDLDGFMKYYDSTTELVFMGSDGPMRSAKVLKEHYESKYKKGKSDFGKLTFSDVEVEELAPGLARAWGKWLVEQKDQKLSGWFSLIWKKTPAGWRIIHDHSS
jgi:beta-aspartyl-peptidase (threonine type)